MSQADTPHTSSDPETPPTRLAEIADLVFGMEDTLGEGLALAEVLIALAEGERPRVRPGTLVFVAYEIRLRLEQLQAEWVRLFRLTNAQRAG